MKAGIKRFVPRKFSKRKDIEDIHDGEIDVSVDQGSESPGRSSPTSSSTGHPVTPEVSVLPQTLDMPSAEITIQGEKNLKSHLNDVKKSLGEIMGSPYKKSQEIVEADEQVPLHHVRKLTDTVVDMLRAMSKKEGEVYLDKSVLPQQQATRYLGSDADEKASLSSGTTSSIKDSEISVKTELLKAQFLPQPQYEGDDVLPFYMDNDSVEACPTFTESIPKSLKKNVKINWPGLVIYIVYIIAFIIYIGIRSAKTLDLGSSLWYGIIVLMSEILGAFAVLPYGLCLVFKVVDPVPEAVTRALNGLPAQTSLSYHIRVLIPCYKEPLDVISKTFLASMFAALPVNCKRTIYLLDDGKDPEKRAFVRSLNMPNAVYISGRKREKGEMNGKSNNINNAMRHIYPGEDLEIPINEIVCVFDADQVPNADFFSKTVPLLDGGEDVAMILTPQAFSNLNHDGDIFNHANVHFWDYTQPGYDALGLISCTGTNFLIRARAFQDCGWFPDWTLTEDFALGIELKRRKWQCRYVDEYLALGEAPDEIRNCFQQRSRWAKGHFQLFSNPKRNPTFGKGAEGLSLLMRWMYGSVALSYFSAFIGTPLLMLVPLVTVWFGVFPIVINIWCAIAVTIYYPATMMVMYYTRSLGHLKVGYFVFLLFLGAF
jgi:cellulose synthase/poly-beta-1,6-N-acetylglucosamine synthase-like glycosyltransferase